MSAPQLPLVSVAIPLFQSRRFFDGIIGNIVAIDYPNLEVIISDRHCADDTIELLAERFASDRRMRCLKGSDRLNWVEHFNLLLRIASGRYFMWMAHDDYYPSDYVSQLVSCLESRPDVVLAYGRLEAVHLDDRPTGWSLRSDLPVTPEERWSLRIALKLLFSWNIWVPCRGVFRRDVVMQSELFIRPTYETVDSDSYWLFGLALKGRFYFVPSCHCKKRFYPTSTGARWGPRRSRHMLSAGIVLCSYIKDFAVSRREACYGMMLVSLWSLLRMIGMLTRKLKILYPQRRSSLRQFLERVLLRV
jgi:glycosyltransferase involved in cell wall biosynthesis